MGGGREGDWENRHGSKISFGKDDGNLLHTSIYITDWDIFAISLALLLKTVPVPALLDRPK